MAKRKPKKRQQKKNTKKQLIQRAGKLGLSASNKLSIESLEDSITQAERAEKAERARQQRNERARRLKEEKRTVITENGLSGVKPSDSWETINKALAKVIKSRNNAILEAAHFEKKQYPRGWTKMDEEKLRSWIDKKINSAKGDKSSVISSDIWLYIGWGDRSGNVQPELLFKAGAYYGDLDNEELRSMIALTRVTRGIASSDGMAGDVVIAYGSETETRTYMEWAENRGYQTIFFGKQIAEKALLRYTNAAMDSCPEDTREYIFQRVNGYLQAAGRSDLKISKNTI